MNEAMPDLHEPPAPPREDSRIRPADRRWLEEDDAVDDVIQDTLNELRLA